MPNEIRHFILTPAGTVREFSPDEAAQVATGSDTLPEFAKHRLRYLQVTVESDNGAEIRVQTAGACIEFDETGRIASADAPESEDERLSKFEYDTCIQWALREIRRLPSLFTRRKSPFCRSLNP